MMRGVLLVMLASGPVFAQAPGATPPSPAPLSVKRWGVGVSLGSALLEALPGPTDPPGPNPKHSFGQIGLSGRLRITPVWELELALEGGNSSASQLAFGGVWLDVRWRPVPDTRWQGYLVAGIGSATASGTSPTDAERKGRGAGRIGGGIERWLGNFVLALELRGIAVSDNSAVTPSSSPSDGSRFAKDTVHGVSVSLGAAYYF
jgi:hypothetical protein